MGLQVRFIKIKSKTTKPDTFVSGLVPRAGIEPTRFPTLVFEINASMNTALKGVKP